MSTDPDCVFCKIMAGKAPGEILYEDEESVVIKDIRPASKYHYLSISRCHITNVNSLISSGMKGLLLILINNGKKVLAEQGGDLNDMRLGFHCPPFNSVGHLHLHVISPVSEMTFLSRMMFKPHTWWFQSVEETLQKCQSVYSQMTEGKL